MVPVLKELGLHQSKPLLLDIGCADLRQYSRECIRISGQYVGIELDVKAVMAGIAKPGRSHGIHLLSGNAEHLPFPHNAFDTVVFCDMLAYCNKEKVVNEIFRVLKPGGYAISLHNNSMGWSFYKVRHPEKFFLTEWAHSFVVLLNSGIYRLTGKRIFRTTCHTRADTASAVSRSGFQLVRAWTTRKRYTWHHFILKKPRDGESR